MYLHVHYNVLCTYTYMYVETKIWPEFLAVARIFGAGAKILKNQNWILVEGTLCRFLLFVVVRIRHTRHTLSDWIFHLSIRLHTSPFSRKLHCKRNLTLELVCQIHSVSVIQTDLFWRWFLLFCCLYTYSVFCTNLLNSNWRPQSGIAKFYSAAKRFALILGRNFQFMVYFSTV